jgi:SAM-dependent methyltransferase
LRRRLQTFRTTAIPWVASLGDLSGKTVLEIGCGTGSSTVALAEQGAIVTALDEDAGSLRVARQRAALHRTPATFLEANSREAFAKYSPESFDIVGMFAVVEHMTLDERLAAIREAWTLIKPGGLLVVVEAPNRLWLQDSHTAMEDFYWWLPDDLAMLWTMRTPRKDLAHAFAEDSPTETLAERKVRLARWGRGVSYHEFCLAFDCKPEDLPVAGAMELYYRKQRNEEKIHSHMWYRRYEAILHSRHPKIHGGFFLPNLDLAFRKPETPLS